MYTLDTIDYGKVGAFIMGVFDTKVNTQIEFIILLTLYMDKDYQREGIRLRNLEASLAENKKLWFTVGHETEEKDFSKRLDWTLTKLEKENNALTRKDSSSHDRVFVPGQQFENYFSGLVATLDETMDLTLKRDANGTIAPDDYIVEKSKDSTETKNLVMLTEDQVKHLSRLAYEFGHNFV